MWNGALFALNPNNPDAARHFCTSAREMMAAILGVEAPDGAVIAANADFIPTPNGGVSRRAKIHHVLARSGNAVAEMVEFVDADIDDVITLFNDFDHGTHGTAGRFPMTELIVPRSASRRPSSSFTGSLEARTEPLGLLDRILGWAEHSRPDEPTEQPKVRIEMTFSGPGKTSLVKPSGTTTFAKEAIAALAGRHAVGDGGYLELEASLQREPDNQADPHAVAVHAEVSPLATCPGSLLETSTCPTGVRGRCRCRSSLSCSRRGSARKRGLPSDEGRPNGSSRAATVRRCPPARRRRRFTTA